MAIMATQNIMRSYNKEACRFFRLFDKKYKTKGICALDGTEYKVPGTLYRVDYINFDLKLIIEWDEETHFTPKHRKKDLQRQKIIQEKLPDFKFVRIREVEVYKMASKIKPGISIKKDIWLDFKEKSKGESSHMVEEFMKEYKPASNRKIQAAVSFDKDIWQRFKAYCINKGIDASRKLEEHMKWRLKHLGEEYPDLVSSNNIRSLSLSNPSQWSLNYAENKIQLSNVSYSCSTGGSDGTSDAAQMYTSAKDIEIE